MANEGLSEDEKQEISSAAEAAMSQDPAGHVKQWLQDVHVATLSTLSVQKSIAGFPTCSVVPFAIDAHGAPFILIASIAAHTRNLRADDRCSLFIRQGLAEGDPQAQWRATLVGRMSKLVVGPSENAGESSVTEDEFRELKARYRERVPASDGYFKTHDFSFWRMSQIEKVRYIAGFGRICWFDGQTLLSDPQPADLSAMSESAIEHMNEDHLDALEVICESLHGLPAAGVRMSGLDRRGFFMARDDTPDLVYTSFGKEIDGGDLRYAMVEVTKRARRSRG